MAIFVFTKNCELALARIEDYVFAAGESLDSVALFLDEHGGALQFIGENPNTPAIDPVN